MNEPIRLKDDEGGATAVEYALIATFVSIAAIFGMSALGITLSNLFSMLGDTIDNALRAAGLI